MAPPPDDAGSMPLPTAAVTDERTFRPGAAGAALRSGRPGPSCDVSGAGGDQGGLLPEEPAEDGAADTSVTPQVSPTRPRKTDGATARPPGAVNSWSRRGKAFAPGGAAPPR